MSEWCQGVYVVGNIRAHLIDHATLWGTLASIVTVVGSVIVAFKSAGEWLNSEKFWPLWAFIALGVTCSILGFSAAWKLRAKAATKTPVVQLDMPFPNATRDTMPALIAASQPLSMLTGTFTPTGVQVTVLRVLAEFHGDGIDKSWLAGYLSLSAVQVDHALNQLMDQGFVEYSRFDSSCVFLLSKVGIAWAAENPD